MITITPMICKIYNALGQSDYDKGFSASTSALRIDENNYLANFLPLGTPEEALLSTALSYIAGQAGSESVSEASTRSTPPLRQEQIASSLSRRATQGVMLE